MSRRLDGQQAALWNVDVAHLTYSTLTAALVTSFLAVHPSALRLAPALPAAVAPALPLGLVAASAGFFAFVIWAVVQSGLWRRGPRPLLHYTLLVCLFSSAAYTAEVRGRAGWGTAAYWWGYWGGMGGPRLLVQLRLDRS